MKRIALMLGLFLMVSFVSAHDVSYKEKYSESKYFVDSNVVVSRTVFVDYDNDNRHSTYDYRHGYSYRATKDYFEDKYFDKKDKKIGFRHYDDGYHYDSGKRYYYEYVPYLRSYDRRECYVSPPADKLFYIKC